MKKQQISQLPHDPQQRSLTLPSTAKLPLESDPVLKKRFESALKLAGSTTAVSPLLADKNCSEFNELLVEHPFSNEVKKKSIAAPEDKTRHKLPIASEEITDNCRQPYDNTPYAIITNKTATKTGNNDKLSLSTNKHKQPITHLTHSLVDKSQPDSQTKTPLSASTLAAKPITNQPIKSDDLAKPIVISPTGEQIVMTYPANKRQPLSTKKIASVADPDKNTEPMEAIFLPEKKPHSANKEQDKGKQQENSIEPPSLPAALSTASAEKMLATVDNEKTSASLLNTLFNKLKAVINVDVNKNYQPPIIQLNIPQLGQLQIKIQQQQQNIMIEFVAQATGQKILLDHRQDLIDKLQRINPDQHIQLVILNDQQSKERSKDQPQSFDDFEEEMI